MTEINALGADALSAFLPRFETDEFAHVDALSASIQKWRPRLGAR